MISAWQWYLKYKDDQKDKDKRSQKNDINFYRKKWLEDEDTIDELRNEIRDLKDQAAKLKGKKMSNLNVIDVATVVAIFVVIVAWIITLVDKVRKNKQPLDENDIFDLAHMIVTQNEKIKELEKKNTTNSEAKKNTAVSDVKKEGENDAKNG